LMVIPALVGLAIVHGFAFGLPLITTDVPGHGPEIEYLSVNNGIMTRHDEEEFLRAIASIFTNQHCYAEMRDAASQTSEHLLLHLSAQRFAKAICVLGDRT
jgi:glycosyltransferase involved in cell wall biosynthesis